MSKILELTEVVLCETCGQGYASEFERCPRCQSNQRKPFLQPEAPRDKPKPGHRVADSGTPAMNDCRMLPTQP